MREYRERREEPSGWTILAGLFVLTCVLTLTFVNAPGMLAMAVIERQLHLSLDVAQMWTFSILCSAILLGGLYVGAGGRSSEAWRCYLAICFCVCAVLLVAQFGFKASFPARYLALFYPGLPS